MGSNEISDELVTVVNKVGTIRVMHAYDAPAVEAVCSSVLQESWSVSAIRNSLLGGACGWVARHENKEIGVLLCLIGFDQADICFLAVSKDFRRQGIARQLMLDFIAHAQEHGVQSICLEVRESNHAAIFFYESMGFRKTSRRKSYYQDGEDALLMVCDLIQDNL